MTGYPCRSSRDVTAFQLDESAKAPWTRTTVGFGVFGLADAVTAFAADTEPAGVAADSAGTVSSVPTATAVSISLLRRGPLSLDPTGAMPVMSFSSACVGTC